MDLTREIRENKQVIVLSSSICGFIYYSLKDSDLVELQRFMFSNQQNITLTGGNCYRYNIIHKNYNKTDDCIYIDKYNDETKLHLPSLRTISTTGVVATTSAHEFINEFGKLCDYTFMSNIPWNWTSFNPMFIDHRINIESDLQIIAEGIIINCHKELRRISGFIDSFLEAVVSDQTNFIDFNFSPKIVYAVFNIIYGKSVYYSFTIDQYNECIKFANYLMLCDDMINMIKWSITLNNSDLLTLFLNDKTFINEYKCIKNIFNDRPELIALIAINVDDNTLIRLYEVYCIHICDFVVVNNLPAKYTEFTLSILNLLHDKTKLLGLISWEFIDIKTHMQIIHLFDPSSMEYKIINTCLYLKERSNIDFDNLDELDYYSSLINFNSNRQTIRDQ